MRTASVFSDVLEIGCRTSAQRLTRMGSLLRRAALAAVAHDALTLAQATAYSAIVAVFPALIVAAAVVGLMPAGAAFHRQFGVFFARVLPSNVVPVVSGYFAVAHPSQTVLSILGSALVSLFGAASVMATLMEGFRRAHDLPLAPGSFLRRRLRALVLVPLSLLPLALASGMVVFGNVITAWLARDLPAGLKPSFSLVTLLLRWLVALGGSTALIALIYHLGTDIGVGVRSQLEPWVREPWNVLRKGWTWRNSLPGAALATALWFVATLLFGVYVTRFADYARVYGSLGAAIALLAWLYIIALCVLTGSEFNAQLAHAAAGPVASAAAARLRGWRWTAPAARTRGGVGEACSSPGKPKPSAVD